MQKTLTFKLMSGLDACDSWDTSTVVIGRTAHVWESRYPQKLGSVVPIYLHYLMCLTKRPLTHSYIMWLAPANVYP